MNTSRNFQNGASRGVGRWSLSTRKDHSTTGGSVQMTRPPFPFPLVGDRMINGIQRLPPQLSPSPHAANPGVNSSREIGYGHYKQWIPETSLNTPPSVLASVSVPTMPTTTAQFIAGAGTDTVNHVSSQLPKGFDLNSMEKNCCEYLVSNLVSFPTGSSYVQPDGSSGASLKPTGSGWDPGSSPAPQRTGLWLIDKYLQSVDQNSSSLTQTTTGRPTTSRDSVRPLVVRSPKSSSESTNEKHSGKEGSSHDRPLHPDLPSGGVLLRAQTISAGDGDPSPKKARAGDGRSKVEPPVDAVTLAVWTEYFKKLYLYNSRMQEERETRTKTDAVDSMKTDAVLVDSATGSASASKSQLSPRISSHKGRAGSKGSGGVGVSSSSGEIGDFNPPTLDLELFGSGCPTPAPLEVEIDGGRGGGSQSHPALLKNRILGTKPYSAQRSHCKTL